LNNQPNVLVVGDSWTYGFGLKETINDPKLWVNQLVRHFWPNANINNLALPGRNNSWIFLEAITELLKNSYDCVIIGWSIIPRWNINVGLELYETGTHFQNMDINLNSGTVSGKFLSDTGDRLRMLHNDHWDFLKLVKYVNTLIEVQTEFKQNKIFFVNALGPWPRDYFTRKTITVPSQLDEFERDLLRVDTRDDNEIIKLYDMIHDQYQNAGGIQELHWLNLYDSLRSWKIDSNPNAEWHPGYVSQDFYTTQLVEAMKNKL
jgi:hypothetical protein